MSTQTQELVAAAMKASGCESVRAFAKQVGVSHVAVGQWMAGENVPSFEQAAELAMIAGLPPVATAASVRMESTHGARHRKVLRWLARVALALVVVAMPFASAIAAPHAAESAAAVPWIAYYVKRWQALRAALARFLTPSVYRAGLCPT